MTIVTFIRRRVRHEVMAEFRNNQMVAIEPSKVKLTAKRFELIKIVLEQTIAVDVFMVAKDAALDGRQDKALLVLEDYVSPKAAKVIVALLAEWIGFRMDVVTPADLNDRIDRTIAQQDGIHVGPRKSLFLERDAKSDYFKRFR